MKRKIWCVVLCSLLLFQLAVPQATAAENVYFVATEEQVQPLSDETMPFWSKGYLYISCSVFSNANWQSLGILSAYNNSKTTAVLYTSAKRAALIFNTDVNYTEDVDGNILYPGPIRRNGQIFAPAALIARYFELTYTVTEVSHGYLVWLRTPNFGLTDQQFANAATYNMDSYYNAYMRRKNQEETNSQKPTQENPLRNKQVFLCLKAGEHTAEQLDVLDRQTAQAAFFCTPSFLAEHGDLLRRMCATGHTIGILADAADSKETVEEQLRKGNESIYQATCGKTRLVYISNDDGTAAAAAEKMGYRCLKADLDRTGYQLTGTLNANALVQHVTAQRGDVTVWLYDTATASGIREFIRVVGQEGCTCHALHETTK